MAETDLMAVPKIYPKSGLFETASENNSPRIPPRNQEKTRLRRRNKRGEIQDIHIVQSDAEYDTTDSEKSYKGDQESTPFTLDDPKSQSPSLSSNKQIQNGAPLSDVSKPSVRDDETSPNKRKIENNKKQIRPKSDYVDTKPKTNSDREDEEDKKIQPKKIWSRLRRKESVVSDDNEDPSNKKSSKRWSRNKKKDESGDEQDSKRSSKHKQTEEKDEKKPRWSIRKKKKDDGNDDNEDDLDNSDDEKAKKKDKRRSEKEEGDHTVEKSSSKKKAKDKKETDNSKNNAKKKVPFWKRRKKNEQVHINESDKGTGSEAEEFSHLINPNKEFREYLEQKKTKSVEKERPVFTRRFVRPSVEMMQGIGVVNATIDDAEDTDTGEVRDLSNDEGTSLAGSVAVRKSLFCVEDDDEEDVFENDEDGDDDESDSEESDDGKAKKRGQKSQKEKDDGKSSRIKDDHAENVKGHSLFSKFRRKTKKHGSDSDSNSENEFDKKGKNKKIDTKKKSDKKKQDKENERKCDDSGKKKKSRFGKGGKRSSSVFEDEIQVIYLNSHRKITTEDESEHSDVDGRKSRKHNRRKTQRKDRDVSDDEDHVDERKSKRRKDKSKTELQSESEEEKSKSKKKNTKKEAGGESENENVSARKKKKHKNDSDSEDGKSNNKSKGRHKENPENDFENEKSKNKKKKTQRRGAEETDSNSGDENTKKKGKIKKDVETESESDNEKSKKKKKKKRKETEEVGSDSEEEKRKKKGKRNKENGVSDDEKDKKRSTKKSEKKKEKKNGMSRSKKNSSDDEETDFDESDEEKYITKSNKKQTKASKKKDVRDKSTKDKKKLHRQCDSDSDPEETKKRKSWKKKKHLKGLENGDDETKMFHLFGRINKRMKSVDSGDESDNSDLAAVDDAETSTHHISIRKKQEMLLNPIEKDDKEDNIEREDSDTESKRNSKSHGEGVNGGVHHADSATVDPEPGEPLYMSCSNLYNLLNDIDKNLLIVDCRDEDSFATNHIKTAKFCETFLESNDAASNISDLSLVVYDANGRTYDLTDSPLSGVVDALQARGLKSHILKQGFDEFGTKYNFMCTSSREEETGSDFNAYPSEIIDGQLFLGDDSHASYENVVKDLSLTHVVDISSEVGNDNFRGKVEYFKVHQSELPYSHLNSTVRFISDALGPRHKGRCLVYCHDSRNTHSGTVAVATVMYLQELSLKDSIAFVKSKRSKLHLGSVNCKSLIKFEKQIWGKKQTDIIELVGS